MEGMNTEEPDNSSSQRFQKPSKYLKFIPLPKETWEKDADQFLYEVKKQLSAAVLLMDIKQGAKFWAYQLQRYLKTYGLRITKKDHIDLVKLMFELIITLDQDCTTKDLFVNVFTRLLRKRELLSPDDLCLPWRPVYRLWKHLLDSKDSTYARKFIAPFVDSMVTGFVKQCRTYFPPEATQEMLDEWRPLICPFDTSMSDAFELFHLFLPTSAPLERHGVMYKLWFDEFMGLYQNLDGSRIGWEAKLLGLFSRLAGHNIGLIDWEPHMPHFFARILKAFGLPVGPAKYQLSHADPSYEFASSFLWAVAVISPTNSGMSLIAQFIRTIEPFMHPSNHGWFQRSLQGAIVNLCIMFTQRVKIERYKKPSWDNYFPEEGKLTDDQITQFVDIVKPVVSTGLFSKHGPQDMAQAMFSLAFLRPERFLPQHLDNLYQALENLTEPHRLKATLAGTLGVARAMVCHPETYPEGKLHMIPILQLCLPGIDSNDSNKTLITFQLISTLITMMPLVDSSEAYQVRTDLTETERELCSQTAQLQDFLFIFIDRIFSLIEGLSLDHHESAAARAKASTIEAVIEAVLQTGSTAVFQQTSTQLYMLSFEKVWRYISNSVFEVLVAGKLACALMFGLIKARPNIALPRVIPHCCKNILELTENKEVVTDERADNSLLWYMLLLSESLRVDGEPLVPYASDIQQVLDRTLHLTNITGHLFACSILQRYLKIIGGIITTDTASVQKDLDTPVAEYLPIRDWGASFNQDDLCIRWNIPSEDARLAIHSMFKKIILEELEYLDTHEDCEREDLQRRLRIINECVSGAAKYLPLLDSEEYIIDDEGLVERVRPKVSTHPALADFNIDFDGKNCRNRILSTIQPLMQRLLTNDDSAKSLNSIVDIYRGLIYDFGPRLTDVNRRAKGVRAVRRSLENPLMPSTSMVRMVLVEYVYLQLARIMCLRTRPTFTKLHASIYKDLVQLATSRYDDVQASARVTLARCYKDYTGSQRLVIPDICQLLITPPPKVTEEQFKGALALVYNSEGGSMAGGSLYHSLAILRDHVILRQLWPAIIQAQHSEKPAVQALVDKIIARVHKNFETSHFSFEVTDTLRDAADVVRSSIDSAPALDLVAGQEAASQRSAKYRRLYDELVLELIDLIKSDKLQWKHKSFAMELVAHLQRPDLSPSLAEVKLFSDNLVHDTVAVRKMCIGVVTGILFSQKPHHPHQYVDSSEFSGYESLQYDPNNIPDTEEKWNQCNFVEKTFWGCTCWPKQVPISVSHPPPNPDELSEVQRYTLDTFSDEQFTDTLFKYLTLEGKGQDRFTSRNYSLFKYLARNYGPPIVEYCKNSVEKLQADTDHLTESSRQRLIAEFVAGMIRGSKYWPFKQMNELFDWILPTVKKAITNVSNDAMTHWGTALATSCEDREPRKLYRLYQFLLEEVRTIGHDSDSATSLETTSRLYFLQGALGQQQWRIPELNAYTTQLIRERLASPFKTIRARLGSVLCSCYIYDAPYINKDCWHNPTRAEFINSCLPLVKDLEDSSDSELGASDSNQGTPTNGQATPTSGTATPTEAEAMSLSEGVAHLMEIDTNGMRVENVEKNRNKLIFKTMLSWVHSNFERHTMYQRWTPEILEFMPIIFPHTANFSDPELRSLCQTVAKYMSKTLLPKELLPQFILAVKEAVGLKSWHARAAMLEILQSVMFLNQFILSDYNQQLLDIVVHLLADERIEVMQTAATTLSGGIQCRFFEVEDSKLVDQFKKLANVRLRSKDNKVERLQRCHTGLLGLGAVVKAYPYDVPTFVPEILMILSDHVNDPQPIQKTVKDVLSEFKRTHHDNWIGHKQMFTDDQLVVLTNLLVSPNYYA